MSVSGLVSWHDHYLILDDLIADSNLIWRSPCFISPCSCAVWDEEMKIRHFWESGQHWLTKWKKKIKLTLSHCFYKKKFMIAHLLISNACLTSSLYLHTPDWIAILPFCSAFIFHHQTKLQAFGGRVRPIVTVSETTGFVMHMQTCRD